jgi:hypothetical protein
MAHILVYLQRTALGLHPASALGLNLARDIADLRGATVTALCAGDGGKLDTAVSAAAGRFGADVLMYCGPEGLEEMSARLRPVHVLAPWTPEGLAAVQGLPAGPAIPRWIEAPRPRAVADSVTGIVAGTLPWHHFDQALEPEYLGQVDAVPMPPWVAELGRSAEPPPVFRMLGEAPLRFIATEGLDSGFAAELTRRGMERAEPADVARFATGTFVWFLAGAGPLPDAITHSPPTCRVILLPGPDATFDPSWSGADLVVAGTWPEAVSRLHEPLWRNPLV